MQEIFKKRYYWHKSWEGKNELAENSIGQSV
jgi:hypothetical protein